jgi:hypothetical protein
MKKQRKPTPADETKKDRLSSRPDGELPTTLDPASPEARGYPTDPKTKPPDGKHTPSTPESEFADDEYTV